mgnify:CR=1 FL=1
MAIAVVTLLCVLVPVPLLTSKGPLLMSEFSPVVRSVVGQVSALLGEVNTNLFRVSSVGEIRSRRLNFELLRKSNSLFPVVVAAETVWVTSDSIREFVIPFNSYLGAGPWDLRVSIIETNRRFYSDCTIDLSKGDAMIVDSVSVASIESIPRWSKEYVSSYNGGDGSTRSIVPARIGRKGGMVHSGFNLPVYIGFGAVPTENPNSLLQKGSRIEIPAGFEGEIFCNFKGQVTPAPSATAPVISVIEYGQP